MGDCLTYHDILHPLSAATGKFNSAEMVERWSDLPWKMLLLSLGMLLDAEQAAILNTSDLQIVRDKTALHVIPTHAGR